MGLDLGALFEGFDIMAIIEIILGFVTGLLG